MDKRMDSIGETLRLEREKRGLSVQEAHDATKIAVQGITALEEDRFESFPNKVYARAFLRDYANFLSLDSASLLDAYEEKWSPSPEADAAAAKKQGGSAWRAIGYSLLVIVLVAALAAGGYYALYTIQHKRAASRVGVAGTNHVSKPEVATIPKAQPVAPPKPEPDARPDQPPSATTPAPAPDKLTLQVSALEQVWVRVKADGKTSFVGNMQKGQLQTFEGNVINIRTGKAGAVQLKLNGVLQPPLGTLKEIGDKTFTMPAPPAAPPAPSPSAPAPPTAP
jgi:cytoskeletal protein RodZ